MILRHHGFEIELDDAWWTEAGMESFVPTSLTYTVNSSGASSSSILYVLIEDIAPVRRNLGINIFNANENTGQTARERVLWILNGFVLGDEIPPVEIVRELEESPHQYRLKDGTHRLYCSLAAGFTHVPAVLVVHRDT